MRNRFFDSAIRVPFVLVLLGPREPHDSLSRFSASSAAWRRDGAPRARTPPHAAPNETRSTGPIAGPRRARAGTTAPLALRGAGQKLSCLSESEQALTTTLPISQSLAPAALQPASGVAAQAHQPTHRKRAAIRRPPAPQLAARLICQPDRSRIGAGEAAAAAADPPNLYKVCIAVWSMIDWSALLLPAGELR